VMYEGMKRLYGLRAPYEFTRALNYADLALAMFKGRHFARAAYSRFAWKRRGRVGPGATYSLAGLPYYCLPFPALQSLLFVARRSGLEAEFAAGGIRIWNPRSALWPLPA